MRSAKPSNTTVSNHADQILYVSLDKMVLSLEDFNRTPIITVENEFSNIELSQYDFLTVRTTTNDALGFNPDEYIDVYITLKN